MSIASIVWSPPSMTPTSPQQTHRITTTSQKGLRPSSSSPPSATFPTSHHRTHLPPVSSIMASPTFQSSKSHNFPSGHSQAPPSPTFSTAGHSNRMEMLSENEHQNKKRRLLSPPIAIAHNTSPSISNSPSSSTTTNSLHHLARAASQFRTSVIVAEPEEYTDLDAVMDETHRGPEFAHGQLPIPRRTASGSSPETPAHQASPNSTRAPPSMGILSSASTSPSLSHVSSVPAGVSSDIMQQWKTPTGHRRGITVKEMLPLEAPTQPRRRSSISANGSTSRPGSSQGMPTTRSPAPTYAYPEQSIDVPRPSKRPRTSSSFADSQSASPAHSSALSLDGEMNDRDSEHGRSPAIANATVSHSSTSHLSRRAPPPRINSQSSMMATELSPEPMNSPSPEDPLAVKRRQNTIAARRSRQRKLEHVRSLEKQVEMLTKERDDLKSRVNRLEDRVGFLKEIVGGGTSAGAGAAAAAAAVNLSPRAPPRSSLGGRNKRASNSWDDDADELYDDRDEYHHAQQHQPQYHHQHQREEEDYEEEY